MPYTTILFAILFVWMLWKWYQTKFDDYAWMSAFFGGALLLSLYSFAFADTLSSNLTLFYLVQTARIVLIVSMLYYAYRSFTKKEPLINKYPIRVDFNNTEEDGAIRMKNPITKDKNFEEELRKAKKPTVWITDGEMETIGKLELRGEIWVAEGIKGSYKNVDPSAYYHKDNLNR